MEFTPTEKSLVFQCESNVKQGVIHELSLRLAYTQEPILFQAISRLLRKLHAMPEEACNVAIANIQKSYIPSAGSKTMGELIAEARRQSGAEKLKGHDIMALERFDPAVRHMIVFDVLSWEANVGDKGDKMRLFLTEAGYNKALADQAKGNIKIRNHATVVAGNLHYDHREREL